MTDVRHKGGISEESETYDKVHEAGKQNLKSDTQKIPHMNKHISSSDSFRREFRNSHDYIFTTGIKTKNSKNQVKNSKSQTDIV